MSTKLIVLGLLREGPKHGYEIKRQFEGEEMVEWTGVSYGAVYSALGKLAAQGLVEKTTVEQVGKGPSRQVYRITDAGRREFIRLLREALRNVSYKADPVDIGFRFLHALPGDEAISLLQERKTELQRSLATLEQAKARFVEQHQGAPYVSMGSLMFDHWLLQLQAELTWLDSVLLELQRWAMRGPGLTTAQGR
jgi:DNA-binding PadR family transcriptional regulator